MSAMLVYLACPYKHDEEWVRKMRVERASIMAGLLMRDGYAVFSPITHCHPIAELVALPTDWAFWERIDRTILERCDKLVVYCLDGWETSVGVNAEIVIAQKLGMPIEYLSPNGQRRGREK